MVLNPDQFQFNKAEPRSMGGSPYHKIDSPVGSLEWHHKTGEIHNVKVAEEHQRQGYATAMYQHAQTIAATTRGVREPRHSSDRTNAGDAWAKSVGGRVPALAKPSASSVNEAERAHYAGRQVSARVQYSLDRMA